MAASSQNDDDGIVGINVTPLVDITLVLLIIFMVTAKIIVSQSVPLDLPKAASGQDVQTVFSIELHANGDTVVDSKKIANDDGITPLAREAHAKNQDLRAVIKADSTVQHGRVIHVLDLLKREGVSKIAFGVTPITDEPGAAPTGAAAPAQPPKP
jgi:biopolymer transport protein ExbD